MKMKLEGSRQKQWGKQKNDGDCGFDGIRKKKRELNKGIDASISFFRCVLKDSMIDRIDFR